MPKKKWGDNPKAVEARTRKENKKREEQEKVERAKEDALWADDDKHLKRKQQRKADKESKKQEQLERKQEKQRLLEEEMAQLKGPAAKSAAGGGGKVTQAQIQAQMEREKQQAAQKAKRPEEEEVAPLEENVNRLIADQLAAEGAVEARSVEEAISVLSVKEAAADRHPERRMKAAYNKYEEENLPRLKQENPNMRLSQLKQMLKKDWMKSPENPMNQRNLAFNAKS